MCIVHCTLVYVCRTVTVTPAQFPLPGVSAPLFSRADGSVLSFHPQPDDEGGQKQEPDDEGNIGVYDFDEGDEGEPQEVSERSAGVGERICWELPPHKLPT